MKIKKYISAALLLTVSIYLFTHCEIRTGELATGREYTLPQEIRISPDAYSME